MATNNNIAPQAFIDEEILLILGQMDPASRIFDFLFLGRYIIFSFPYISLT